MSTKLQKLCNIARKVAELSSFKVQISAILFNNGKILSVGYCKNKSHPICRKYFKHGTVHAEVDAILKIRHYGIPKGSEIIVFRQYKDGSAADAMPCPQCTKIMHEFGIATVYCTTTAFPYWARYDIADLIANINPEVAYAINKYGNSYDENKNRSKGK